MLIYPVVDVAGTGEFPCLKGDLDLPRLVLKFNNKFKTCSLGKFGVNLLLSDI